MAFVNEIEKYSCVFFLYRMFFSLVNFYMCLKNRLNSRTAYRTEIYRNQEIDDKTELAWNLPR